VNNVRSITFIDRHLAEIIDQPTTRTLNQRHVQRGEQQAFFFALVVTAEMRGRATMPTGDPLRPQFGDPQTKRGAQVFARIRRIDVQGRRR